MIIPYTNVNLATKVRDILNEAGGKVNNNLISFFSPEAKLNKWSKHKPVKYSNPFPLDEDDYDRLYSDKLYWWKAYNGLCGFKEDSIKFNSIDALIQAYQNGNTYVYELPTGGQQYPYRLGDFRGYNTEAKSPIWSFEITGGDMIMDEGGYSDRNNSYHTFTIMSDQVDEEHNLTFSDIAPDGTDFTLHDWFFGVAVTDGKNILFKKDSNMIGYYANGDNWVISLDVTLTELADKAMANFGQFVVYPIITNGEAKKFIACDVPPVEFSIKLDPAIAKVGWMDSEPHYCKMTVNGALSFYATLAWNKDYENSSFNFESYYIDKNGKKEIIRSESNITPQKNAIKENDDNVYYMYISPEYFNMSGKSSIQEGATYYLSVAFTNSYGVLITDIIECELKSSNPDDL